MTKTELHKAIEHHYGSGILMAFTDLIHEGREMITKENCVRVKLTCDNGESFEWGYLVDGEFYDFDESEIDEDNPYGLAYLIEPGCWELFEQKPRTRTEYVKVTESIFDLKEEFERGELYTKKFNQEWHQIKTEIQLGGLLSMNDDPEKNGIYRRIETPITEREEFIERGEKVWGQKETNVPSLLGDMFDAGCRFVNGKG